LIFKYIVTLQVLRAASIIRAADGGSKCLLSSENSILFYETTRRNIPEDSRLHSVLPTINKNNVSEVFKVRKKA